jgi:hypothetical protein
MPKQRMFHGGGSCEGFCIRGITSHRHCPSLHIQTHVGKLSYGSLGACFGYLAKVPDDANLVLYDVKVEMSKQSQAGK